MQDLSDCQVALSFWFHINVVSFLPPLSSPALLHSSPCSAVCSFSSAPLSPRLYRKRSGRRKFGRNFQPCSHAFSILYFPNSGWKQLTSYHQMKANSNITFHYTTVGKGQRCTHVLTGCHSLLVS